MTRLIWLSALLVLTQSAPPQQTFRSGAQVVEVDVRVLADGKFVTDLSAGDFQISEDGVPQRIVSAVLIAPGPPAPAAAPLAPVAPSAPAPLAPRSAPPAPSARQRSLWLFVFDTTHLTPGPFQRARDAAAAFFAERFHEGDIGGVVVDGKMINNRLTSDREELKAAAQSVKIPGDLRSRQLERREWPRLLDETEAIRILNNEQQALRTAVLRACADDSSACGRGSMIEAVVREKARRMAEESRRAANQTLVTIVALCNGLARLPGAKSVVFFSEGFVVHDMEAAMRQATGQAARAGAHFYSIDARGLNKGGSAELIDQPLVANEMGPSNAFDLQADGSNSLAVDTGGFAIRNENNFQRALDEIEKDARTYYVVAYVPTNTAFDGKYRSIDVKVSRPGVKVRARRGYLALAPAAYLDTNAAVPPKPPSEGAAAKAEAVPPKPFSDPPAKAEASIDPVSAPAFRDPIEILRALGREGQPAATPESAGSVRMRPSASASAEGNARFGGTSSPSANAERDARFGATSSPPTSAAELGWSAYERGDVETASRHLAEAAKAADARPWVVYALGMSQFALRQYGDAAQSWERVRRDVPAFEPIYFSLADAYGLLHEESAALKVLREAEQRWPQDPEISNAIGVIHVKRAALDAAIDAFARAIAVAPSDALGYFNLGRACQIRFVKQQRYDPQMEKWIGREEDRRRAIASFEKYLQLGGPYERQAKEALAALAWK